MKTKIVKKNAGFFIVMISIMLLTPTIAAIAYQRDSQLDNYNNISNYEQNSDTFDVTKIRSNVKYVPFEETKLSGEQNDIGYNVDAADTKLSGEQNDIGYNVDAADTIQKGVKFPLYVGEPVDERIPGRGRTGTLSPDEGDDEDWYSFSVCKGQTIESSVTGGLSVKIADTKGQIVDKPYTAVESGRHFICVFEGVGEYTISVSLSGQNDADTGGDAGSNIDQATSINPGEYYGYMDSNDWEDWYSFDVETDEGIFVELDPLDKSDYNIHLYNPDGEWVHSEQFYEEDMLEYPANMDGTWKIKIDIFPGWDESKWPDDYFLYGSGAYELGLEIGGTAEAPPVPVQQPEIIPVAQTFIIDDDPNSNKDEYGYLAAVPAANYIEGGERYVSPIVYQGVDIIPTWSTTVDQTTQYLIDDWNTYLERHGEVASEYVIPSDPVQAAAGIATSKWTSSNTAVVAIDGSDFEDEINELLDQDFSLSSIKEISSFQPNDLKELVPDLYSSPMYLGSKWGAIHVVVEGENFDGDTMVMTPRFESLMADWWPHEYPTRSGNTGSDYDTFIPVSIPGVWIPQVTSIEGLDELKIIKYPGNRHKLSVGEYDSSLKVTITTEEESRLVAYLIDPEGNIRRPAIPHYNGGDINPLHQWNGGHWEQDEGEFRHWIVEPHTEFSVEVHNPIPGTWTAIVVPYLNHNTWDTSFDGSYHITASLREHSSDRISAALSASNGAVIASLKHAPLLYVTKDSVPSETSNALTQLGVTNVIFVNIGGVSSASPSGSVTEYETMQEVIDAIKADSNSENYITLTSFATGEGYFAPSGMIAAYHGSPILNFGEAKESYNALDIIITWREYDGDYYHGCRSLGALPMMNEPSNIENPPSLLELIIYFFTNDRELPPVGLDLKLNLFTKVHNGVQNMIDGFGLDKEGQEAYLFVSPRDTDIRDPISRVMMGNNSLAGQIPVETTAFSSAIICRNILYPAIIYANPGRDVTTSQHMNYFTAQYDHVGNDGIQYYTDGTKVNKNSLSSHNRFYEGHCIWDNLLERYNEGAALSFYSGHGTGGSGISAQYKNIAEQFPLATPVHDNLYDFEWWDSWAGYSGYDEEITKTVRDRAMSIYNGEEPSLYDFIHFKWIDQLFENLHSEIEIWSSCTTAAHFGPIVYFSHGSTIYAGCTGSGYTLVDDLYKSWILRDFLIKGWSIGEAFSNNNWIVNRDYTTMDPSSIYGEATFFADGIHSVNIIFGDPTIQCYNPTWNEPIPITP